MPLFGRAIESITEQDLLRLIEDEVPEGKTIDYKMELNLATGDDKKEFLADVTSFANTAGGHLLIGIKPCGDQAFELVGMAATPEEQDRFKQQIENLLRDSIDPRLPLLQQRFVSLASGNHILVLRIDQSWAGPHMVKTSSKFFARNSAGKFALDTQQLRATFAATDDIGRRMGAWRTERIGKILADEAPWNLPAGPKLIVHLMPQAAFASSGHSVYLGRTSMLPMIGHDGWPTRPNFDGWICRSPSGDAVTQMFRSGCVEGADASTLGEGRLRERARDIDIARLELHVTDFLQAAIALLHRHEVAAPAYVCVTLAGIQGRRLTWGNYGSQGDPVPQKLLVLPEAQIDDMRPGDLQAVFALLRAVFDVLWQAFGNEKSRNYDATGKWVGAQIGA